MSGVTKEEVMHFQRAVLKRIFNARAVDGAIADVAEQMGWPALEELGNGPSSVMPISMEKASAGGGKGGKGKKRKKEGAEGAGKEGAKARGPRSVSAYTLFITLAMDMMAHDPDNPAFKVPEKLDEHGQPVKGRGAPGKMTAASGLWSSLSEQQKASFQQVFKPLTDTFNKETHETGTKVQDVASRVKEFKQSLPALAQQELHHIFEHAMANNPRSSGHPPSPSANHHYQQQQTPAAEEVPETGSSDESEEEEEEGPSQQQQLREQEARRLQQEAKEKRKEGKEGKDGKKEKKKEGKVKEGKKGEEGSTKKKKKTVVSDDSS